MLLDTLSPPFQPSTKLPTSPLSPKQMCFLESTDIEIPNPFTSEYENLNAQLRCRVQDYEIALLKLQLRDRDRELQSMLETRQKQEPHHRVTDMVVRIGKQQDKIEKLNAEVHFWKVYAMEAKGMLERTYSDLAKVHLATAKPSVTIHRPEQQKRIIKTRLPVPKTRLNCAAKPITQTTEVIPKMRRKDSVMESD